VTGTVTISLEDFESLKKSKDKLRDYIPALKSVEDDIYTILDTVNKVADIDKVAAVYNDLDRSTIITLKSEGWRLMKRKL
jgi:predicted AAA+ superfamily ATPase